MSQTISHEETIGNYRLKVYPDSNPINPREDFDNLCKMVCSHNRYKLGDDHDYRTEDFNSWDEMKEQIIKDHNPKVIKPLYLYDHSGITMSTSPFSCRWDSEQVGWIFVLTENIKGMCGDDVTDEQLEKYLDGEVETYDQYLIGDVYGYEVFRIKKCNFDHDHEESLESVWGYYGEQSAIDEGKSMIEFYMKEDSKEVLV